MLLHARHDRTLPLHGEESAIHPGLVVFRFGARLFYANVHPFYRTVLGLVQGAAPPLQWLVLDLRAVGDIDYTAAEMLIQLHREITGQDIRLILAGVDEETRTLLVRLGLLEVFGSANVYERLRQPIEEYAGRAVTDHTDSV